VPPAEERLAVVGGLDDHQLARARVEHGFAQRTDHFGVRHVTLGGGDGELLLPVHAAGQVGLDCHPVAGADHVAQPAQVVEHILHRAPDHVPVIAASSGQGHFRAFGGPGRQNLRGEGAPGREAGCLQKAAA